jgi:hypothetical protein
MASIDYDEDLETNPFFVAIRRDYPDLFQQSLSEGFLIAVPRRGSVVAGSMNFDRDDILRHILVANDDFDLTRFHTLDGVAVVVVSDGDTVKVICDESDSDVAAMQSRLNCDETVTSVPQNRDDNMTKPQHNGINFTTKPPQNGNETVTSVPQNRDDITAKLPQNGDKSATQSLLNHNNSATLKQQNRDAITTKLQQNGDKSVTQSLLNREKTASQSRHSRYNVTTKLLFSETFYDDDMNKLQLWCVAQPFSQIRLEKTSHQQHQQQVDDPLKTPSSLLVDSTSVIDCVDFLRKFVGGQSLLTKIQELARDFQRAIRSSSPSNRLIYPDSSSF